MLFLQRFDFIVKNFMYANNVNLLCFRKTNFAGNSARFTRQCCISAIADTELYRVHSYLKRRNLKMFVRLQAANFIENWIESGIPGVC